MNHPTRPTMDTAEADDTSADTLISDSVARLFGSLVDKGQRERAEAGALDTALWQQVEAAGFTRLLASEAAGGLGLGWAAAYPVLRGLGAWQVPLPVAETLVAAQLLSLAGLPVPDGPLTLIEASRCPGLQVSTQGAGVVLQGTAHGVPWARHARGAVVSLGPASPGGPARLAWLDLQARPGLVLQAQVDTAGLPADTLQFDALACDRLATLPLALAEPVWTLGALARSIMMVGALEWVLDQAVSYAGDRVQFGKPIGKNQVIQQNLALLAGDVAASRMAALVAAGQAPGAEVPANDPGAGAMALFSIAVAKVRCGEAATRGTGIAHQVHGAIGFTHEHALHFATRRLWAWREQFGTDAQWAARLGRAAIEARSAGFWPSLSQQRFSGLR